MIQNASLSLRKKGEWHSDGNVKTCVVLTQNGNIFITDESLLQNVKKFHQEFNKRKPIFLKRIGYIWKGLCLKYGINKEYVRTLSIKWI